MISATFAGALFILTPLTLKTSMAWADSIAENQARFGVSTGTVQLLSSGAVNWIDIHEGVPLEVGDRIRTDDDGEVDLVMSGNVLWKLEPNSQLVAEHMESNEGRFQLESGSLLGKVDSQQAQAGQHWEFDMPTAIVTIRGTEFVITVPKPGETRLGVFEGSVDLQPAETASGVVDPIPVLSGQEGISLRGKALKVVKGFTAPLRLLAAKRAALQASFVEMQRTWTPFTEEVRQEIRKKFVPAAPKHISRPPPGHRTRVETENPS